MNTTCKNLFLAAFCGMIAVAWTGCTPQKTAYDKAHILEVAEAQVDYQIKLVEEDQTQVLNPRSVVNGVIQYIPIDDWCSGFFPGIIWEMYRLTGDEKYLPYAEKYTEALDSIKHLKWHHDVGFMMDCSYGQGLSATGNPAYAEVLVETARSLATRFRPAAGVFQSWDEDRGWQGERGWMCPTIIDNMMNLELMFKATQISGDSTFWHMAVSHADTTLKYHFRDDYSTYHVIATEVITDDDWMMAVKSAPITTSRIGLPIVARNCFTASSWAKSSIEPDIMLKPTNSIPKPVMIPPTFFHISCLANRQMNAPTPASAAKIVVVLSPLPDDRPRATI